MNTPASTASAITDEQIVAFKEAFHSPLGMPRGYDEALRDGLTAALAAPTTQPVGQGDCGNADCAWRGPLSECSYLGAVGPCCPNCREIVEPDLAAVEPSQPASGERDLVYFRRPHDDHEDCVTVPRGTATAHVRAELITRVVTAPAAPSPDAQDAARYRAFFDAGLPITFCGVDCNSKHELDAAIDAALAASTKGAAS